MGVFARIIEGLASEAADRKTVMIDATYLKAHRMASSPRLKKAGAAACSEGQRTGMSTKLHAVTDANNRPIKFFVAVGHVSDCHGAAALPSNVPETE